MRKVGKVVLIVVVAFMALLALKGGCAIVGRFIYEALCPPVP